MIYFLLFVLLIIDLLTKYYFLHHPGIIKVFKFLNFKLALNSGVAFSLFKRDIVFTVLIPAVVLIICLFFFFKEKNKYKKFFLGLVIIGGISNLIERIIFGKVTDFIDFHIKNWHYPTFNLADVYITLGFLLYIIYSLKDERVSSK